MKTAQPHIAHQERIIEQIIQSYELPTVILIGGIHGNEQSGIIAIEQFFQEIKEQNVSINGNIIGLRGNLKALQQNERFIDRDLNRAWTKENIHLISQRKITSSEAEEVIQLKETIDKILEQTKAPVLMLDLHTTSSFSPPFCVIDDTLRNREMAMAIPVPKVLGLIEKLTGTILGYYGDKGPISIVYEAGQHEDKESPARHKAAIYLALNKFKSLSLHPKQQKQHEDILLNASKNVPKLVETSLRFALKESDHFQMEAGFSNFDSIEKGQLIAHKNSQPIHAESDGYIFMPLYQTKGEDGFFVVKKIAPFWLKVSKFLRKKKLHTIVRFLPGITKHPSKPHTYVVNKRIASFKSLELLRLLGFRKVKQIEQTLFVSRLPYDTKGPWG